jgi:hypothetical protein
MAHMFKSENKSKWGMLVEYITGKANNNEIIQNVIDERNNNKVKSLEEVNLGRKRNHCKKKQNKLTKYFRNNPNFAASEAFATVNNTTSKNLCDPRSSRNLQLKGFDQTELDRRECMSKSPIDLNTLTLNEPNKICLKPIVSM